MFKKLIKKVTNRKRKENQGKSGLEFNVIVGNFTFILVVNDHFANREVVKLFSGFLW